MLVLSRKVGEELLIGDVVLTVKKVSNGRVTISIQAPPEIRILRGEKGGSVGPVFAVGFCQCGILSERRK